jgi:hypothetical protein
MPVDKVRRPVTFLITTLFALGWACSSTPGSPSSTEDAGTAPGTDAATQPGEAGADSETPEPEPEPEPEPGSDSGTPGVDAAPTGPQTLATSTARIYDLTVLGNDVFYVENDAGNFQVKAVSTAGGAPRTLASGSGGFRDLAVVGGFAYYTSSSALFRVPTTGGAPTELATGTGWIAVGPTDVYFSDGIIDLTLYRVPIGGGQRQTVLSDVSVSDLTLAGSDLYWTAVDGVEPASTDGSNQRVLVNITRPGPIALTANTLLFVDNSMGTYPVREVPLTGGTSNIRVTGLASGSPLVVDGAEVLFGTGSGRLAVAPIATGTTRELSPVRASSVDIKAIAVDATSRYWVETAVGGTRSTLYRLAK